MSASAPSIGDVIGFLRGLHDSITGALERADGGGRFRRDTWQRPPRRRSGAG